MDDSDGQIDELLLHSTPNTEPALIEELFNAQMGVYFPFPLCFVVNFMLIIEVPQFPRSRKIRGHAGIKPHILAGKTFVSLR